MYFPDETQFPDVCEHFAHHDAMSFHADLCGAGVTLAARIGPCGVLMDLIEYPCCEGYSSLRRPRRVSADAHCSHGGLADRSGRWASGWTMVAGYPARMAPDGDPFADVRREALDLLDRQRRRFRLRRGRTRRRDDACTRDLASIDEGLRRIAESTLRRLDDRLVRLARRVPPVMRWWLYEVAVLVRREFGPEGERNLAQAVECIPGVLLFAFALDDPQSADLYGVVTDILRDIGRGSRRAPQLVDDAVDAWMRRRRELVPDPVSRLTARHLWRLLREDTDPFGWRLPAGLSDEALRRAQRQLVLRASRYVAPDLLLVPAPPRWAPEDVPTDPHACARWFAVVQGARRDPVHGRVSGLVRRYRRTWDPAFSGFVSAHALALWHRDRERMAEGIAAIELWAAATGRRPCRASNPATLLAEAGPFRHVVRRGTFSGRGVRGALSATFDVPAAFAYAGEGVRVEPIRSPVELIGEAARMRNCLADYVGKCGRGDYVVCRAEVDGRPWVLGIRRVGDRWVLEQVAGPRNRPMPTGVFDALAPYFEAADIVVPGRRASLPAEDAEDAVAEPRGLRLRRMAWRFGHPAGPGVRGVADPADERGRAGRQCVMPGLDDEEDVDPEDGDLFEMFEAHEHDAVAEFVAFLEGDGPAGRRGRADGEGDEDDDGPGRR
ncbi:MAG: hypothetical protein D6705_13795 [Deltaproteobacteria bacterium]|nr:MAG: hypothetical protein D6705_13795 [Deltaproteobacteria bacterium]